MLAGGGMVGVERAGADVLAGLGGSNLTGTGRDAVVGLFTEVELSLVAVVDAGSMGSGGALGVCRIHQKKPATSNKLVTNNPANQGTEVRLSASLGGWLSTVVCCDCWRSCSERRNASRM